VPPDLAPASFRNPCPGPAGIGAQYTFSMSKSYSVADARAHLPDILDDVEAGKEVELTRLGKLLA